MTTQYELVIGNRHIRSEDQEYFPTINPYTGETWAYIPQASEEQVAEAIRTARKAFDTTWSKTTGYQRSRLMIRLAELLEANADRMARLETTDNGKCIRETSGQMISAAR